MTEETETAPPVGFTLPNGMYVFLVAHDKSHEDVMELYPYLTVFYMLGGNATEKAAWYKVVNTPSATSVSKVTDPHVGLVALKETAMWGLPKIPLILMDKMDAFFRTVAGEKHTEAIVLLTFDPEFFDKENASEGWGVLVPDQENDAGHCDYDVTSVVDDKPDHVMIVGSAHSHPNMTAFASGTDHADQADFDGLHITFGYPHKVSGTEYYAELQMGGGVWKMKMEQIVEDFQEPPPPEDVAEWAKKVKKKLPSYTPPTHGGYQGSLYPGNNSSSSNSYMKKTLIELNDPANRPDGCPNPNVFTIVVNVTDTLGHLLRCPVCSGMMTKPMEDSRRCGNCLSFMAYPLGTSHEMVSDILAARKDIPSTELDYFKTPQAVKKPIVFWDRSFDHSKKNVTFSAVRVLYAADSTIYHDQQVLDKDEIAAIDYPMAGGLPFA